ncbi:MAG: type II secretion system F family protein, partial [Actinomycetota bacterium]|nr:type II secretion system F family protein [Actinomycetota bacterium]
SIDTARGLQVTPWEALGALGEEIGVEEMVELSLHIGLAGREGARVRASLAAKADSLRRREMAREEAQANAITEKMFLPGVVLMAGFMVFIGYPALESVFRAA